MSSAASAASRSAARSAARLALVAGATGLALVAGLGLAGCGTPAPTKAKPSPTVLPPLDARDELAGRAAAAKDRRYVTTYQYSAGQTAARTITVAYATDSSWAVSVPGGALGGYANIAIIGINKITYECTLGPAEAAIAAGGPLVDPACVQVKSFRSGTDPRVQHLFTDWIDPLTDRDAALSVVRVPLIKGARGVCYSVEPNSAALAPPVDPGIYCYDQDGTLTAAKLAFGTVTLTGTPAAAPATVTLPAPIVAGKPWSLTAPPTPPALASPTPSS